MDTSAVPLQRLAFSLTLALIAVIVLTVLMNDANARSYALPSPRASASEPSQEPPLCLADVAIVLDVGGSMQEDTRCYGCWEGAGDYPQGTTYPLPFGDHCRPSDPLVYQGYYYLFIEAEHYSQYPYEADYHRDWTEFPKTWWAMQRQPNRSASGPDVRGAFMMVGPNSPGALYYETLDDIRHPPDLHTTPRMEVVLEFISEQVRRNCWPVYGLSKKVMPSPVVTVGQQVTYTLVITTNRPDMPVTLTDTLPSGTAFISASGDYTPTAPGPGDVLAWPLTPTDWIEGVAQRTLVLSVMAVPSDGLLTNIASIAGITGSAVLTVGEPEKYRLYLPLVVKGGT